MSCRYCPFDLLFRLIVRRLDGLHNVSRLLIKLINKQTGVTRYPSLSNRATNEMLTQCWFMVVVVLQMMAHYLINIGLPSHVCCGLRGELSLLARLPLIKPYACEGHLCSCFLKYCY